MSVKINIAPYLQPYTDNKAVVEVNGSQVGECLNQLVGQFPGMGGMLYMEEGKLWPYVVVLVNFGDADSGNLAKPVNDGDKVYIGYVFYQLSYPAACC